MHAKSLVVLAVSSLLVIGAAAQSDQSQPLRHPHAAPSPPKIVTAHAREHIDICVLRDVPCHLTDDGTHVMGPMPVAPVSPGVPAGKAPDGWSQIALTQDESKSLHAAEHEIENANGNKFLLVNARNDRLQFQAADAGAVTGQRTDGLVIAQHLDQGAAAKSHEAVDNFSAKFSTAAIQRAMARTSGR